MEHTPEEAAWIANRMDELAAKRYSAEAIEQARQLPKSGAEISAETAERYRERQQRSTSLHEQVGEMDKRGRERDAARKAGVSSGFTEGRDAYRAAVRAAEERAAFGEVRTAYDPNAVERVATPGGYGPAGDWPDELGPAI